jgi:hypothetical protein
LPIGMDVAFSSAKQKPSLQVCAPRGDRACEVATLKWSD